MLPGQKDNQAKDDKTASLIRLSLLMNKDFYADKLLAPF